MSETFPVDHQLEHRFTIRAAPRAVWDFLWDIEAITRCIEGCENVVVLVEGTSYRAGLRRRIGPFSLRLDLTIDVIERVAPTKTVLQIEGVDWRLRSRVEQTLTVLVGEGSTPAESRVQILAALQVEGILASLAKPLVSMHAAENIEQFALALTRAVEQEALATAPPIPGERAPAPNIAPPGRAR